jgi:hypothetical protein
MRPGLGGPFPWVHGQWVKNPILRRPRGRPPLASPESFGVSILEFRGHKIARESIYVTEGWEPPEWRAP